METLAQSNTSLAISRRNAIFGAATAGALLAASGTAAQSKEARPLDGKAAVVTGARNNLGRGFAVALASMGADVLIHHHKPETWDQAEETARLCHEQGVRTAIFAGDLGSAETVLAMYDACHSQFGSIDIVVNNAGRIWKGNFADIPDEEFERCLAINTKAMFYSMRQAAQRLAENGRVINIATSLLCATSPFYAAYAGTKAPIEELTRTLARELGARGITVNAIAPGAIDTPFFHGPESKEAVAYITNSVPAKRLGKIDDIAPVVAFLATPEAQWISGQTLWINGSYGTR
ncbi:SDR family oxidoreductase [Rhizobium sp. MHM7A]|uniref:SDR family oxidoreductase n=1 Tax=Rhizobium sp. MHM7A TaxID=2583233 RepID=UPI0011074584|nr:SDR family oxidoreductase [Rhizobium sp. MHM7A]TLX13057.1 SDR family oxidoreductase [Rhizobium sp. MHM7A]